MDSFESLNEFQSTSHQCDYSNNSLSHSQEGNSNDKINHQNFSKNYEAHDQVDTYSENMQNSVEQIEQSARNYYPTPNHSSIGWIDKRIQSNVNNISNPQSSKQKIQNSSLQSQEKEFHCKIFVIQHFQLYFHPYSHIILVLF